MDAQRFTGLGVALATPFSPAAGRLDAVAPDAVAPDAVVLDAVVLDERPLDLPAFRNLVHRTFAGGADFLVVLGSTGEGATVLESERDLLVRAALEEAGGRPIVVGTGHNSTAQAVELARRAAELGADALLVVTPYYNKPQPAGLEAHFRAVAEATPGMPIIAYNVPGRTGQNLGPKELARLWSIPQVIAVKESSGNLAQIGEIGRTLPAGKILLAGDDALALPAIALGASGLVSVIGNILPAEIAALVRAALAGERARAMALHYRLLPLMDTLFLESNPVPVKAALSLAGLCSDAPRLPLVPASESTRARLAELLAGFGLVRRPLRQECAA